jgi:hypothetical protein
VEDTVRLTKTLLSRYRLHALRKGHFAELTKLFLPDAREHSVLIGSLPELITESGLVAHQAQVQSAHQADAQ